MDRPKAKMKMTSGMVASSEPTGSKPKSPDRWPSWNTQTRAPNVAPSDSTFITTALAATTTEPVMRKRSTSVARTTRPRARGRRSTIDALKSTSSAASPVTKVGNDGRLPRRRWTTDCAVSPCSVPSGTTSTTDAATPGATGETLTDVTPGMARTCST